MLDALKSYLTAQGYTGICIDTMPDVSKQRDVIYLGKWDHTVADINDGTGVQYIQIQVRRGTYDEAHTICDALFKLLDSGLDEKRLQLTPDVWCIARPRRGPLILERGGTHTTFYCETALWGEN